MRMKLPVYVALASLVGVFAAQAEMKLPALKNNLPLNLPEHGILAPSFSTRLSVGFREE